MNPLRTLLVVSTLVAITGALPMSAIAAPFQIEVSVGWISSTGLCGDSACLGFAGTGGNGAGLFAGTSTRLNWDDQTGATDSLLSIGALPDVNGFGNPPVGFGQTAIDVGETLRWFQIRHTDNTAPENDDVLESITVRMLLRILSADGTVEILGAGDGGLLDVPLTLLETANADPCTETSNSLGSTCDDQLTFVRIVADVPFTFESHTYVLQVRGLLNQDGTTACEEAGGGLINCLTREGEVSDRFTAITLRQIDVPVPAPTSATLMLLGLGLGGMRVLHRLLRPRAALARPSRRRRSC